jgi:hypothetical protein
MRPLLRVGLPLLLAALALLVLWQTFRTRTEALAFRAERARLQRELVERAVVARGLGADHPREAADEGRALLRWYFEELQAAHNRHPRHREATTLAALLEARPGLKAEEKQTLQEFFAYAEERLQALRGGRYDPLFTAGARTRAPASPRCASTSPSGACPGAPTASPCPAAAPWSGPPWR